MLHAVIMAGGSGTRFWPVSRAQRPKQLLPLAGERSMIEMTVDRLEGLAPIERIRIATTQRLAEPILDTVDRLGPTNLITEPCRRDTAPCVALAARLIAQDDPDAIMALMPADHVIAPADAFQSAIREAVTLIEDDPQRLVTFGIKPSVPSDAFGYIQWNRARQIAGDGPATYPVVEFKEKPSIEVAKQYLAAGNYFWNSGIFIWRAATILDLLTQFEPDMMGHINAIGEVADSSDFDKVLGQEFAACRAISIDYAVLERADNRLVIEAPFDWDDVGGWSSLPRLRGVDELENTAAARHLTVEENPSTGTIIYSTDPDHLIATVGLKNCIVVHTSDATLVADRTCESSIRALVKEMERRGLDEYL